MVVCCLCVSVSGVPAYVMSGRERPARTQPTALLSPSSDGKPEAATAVVELLIMGIRVLETCWAVFKRQVINLRNFCIWLVDSFESHYSYYRHAVKMKIFMTVFLFSSYI